MIASCEESTMAEKWANCSSAFFPFADVAGKRAVILFPVERHVIDADLHRENLARVRAMASFKTNDLFCRNRLPVRPPPLRVIIGAISNTVIAWSSSLEYSKTSHAF